MPTGQTTFEIEIDFSGDVDPGQGPTMPSMNGPGDPGYGPEVHNLTVEGVFALRHRFDGHKSSWDRHNLLEGCDLKSPDIIKLLANIEAFAGDEIDMIEDDE